MKLVASSKLRKAQKSIEALRPYEETLNAILAAACGSAELQETPKDFASPLAGVVKEERSSDTGEFEGVRPFIDSSNQAPLAVLAFASNSSMCGAFNANAIKKTIEVARACASGVETWAFGRKMADALRKGGFPAARDYSQLVAHPSFEAVAQLAAELRERYYAGEISGVILVYNHFVSTGKQQVVVEDYLSKAMLGVRGVETADNQKDTDYRQGKPEKTISGNTLTDSDFYSVPDYIIEPSRSELVSALMPQVLDLKLYAALLDSAASEHAARMIAMQAATDNGETLLGELTLEYNKGRQQKITSEILDLVGGASEQ
jgi:F-type H+-transporting ATPase subunit gamma